MSTGAGFTLTVAALREERRRREANEPEVLKARKAIAMPIWLKLVEDKIRARVVPGAPAVAVVSFAELEEPFSHTAVPQYLRRITDTDVADITAAIMATDPGFSVARSSYSDDLVIQWKWADAGPQ